MKVLFIHGLASSGAYKMASSLRILLKPCEVIAPDVPIDPHEALQMLTSICRAEKPELVVGLSMGGFWAQKLRGCRKILVNPSFHTSSLLRSMIGEVEYLSPRADGATSFTVTPEICDAYEALEAVQYDGLDETEIALTRGLFADADERVRWQQEFEAHYPGRSVSYPGGHLPSFPQLKQYLVPVILEEVPHN